MCNFHYAAMSMMTSQILQFVDFMAKNTVVAKVTF